MNKIIKIMLMLLFTVLLAAAGVALSVSNYGNLNVAGWANITDVIYAKSSSDPTNTTAWIGMEYRDTEFGSLGTGEGDLTVAAVRDVKLKGDTELDSNLYVGDTSNYELLDIASNGTDVSITSSQSLDIYIDSDGGNIRVPTATNITWDNGGSIWVNSTCVVITSPAGSGVYAVCD